MNGKRAKSLRSRASNRRDLPCTETLRRTRKTYFAGYLDEKGNPVMVKGLVHERRWPLLSYKEVYKYLKRTLKRNRSALYTTHEPWILT